MAKAGWSGSEARPRRHCRGPVHPVEGHEQAGLRPCVVVSDPDVARYQRFPVICIVPITSTPAVGILYPRLEPGRHGLTRTSYALVDQIRSIDRKRVRNIFSAIPASELRAIDNALASFLDLKLSNYDAAN